MSLPLSSNTRLHLMKEPVSVCVLGGKLQPWIRHQLRTFSCCGLSLLKPLSSSPLPHPSSPTNSCHDSKVRQAMICLFFQKYNLALIFPSAGVKRWIIARLRECLFLYPPVSLHGTRLKGNEALCDPSLHDESQQKKAALYFNQKLDEIFLIYLFIYFFRKKKTTPSTHRKWCQLCRHLKMKSPKQEALLPLPLPLLLLVLADGWDFEF